MKQVPKPCVRQARAWGSWAVPPPSVRGVLRVQVGTGSQARSSWERVAGLLQTPVPSAKAYSIPEGLLHTVCVLGQGGPGASCTLEGLAPGSLQEPLCWGQQLSSLS